LSRHSNSFERPSGARRRPNRARASAAGKASAARYYRTSASTKSDCEPRSRRQSLSGLRATSCATSGCAART
ncbi:hypothetical protein ABTK34_19375, partial [Acinetobacter baumannii]